MGESWFGRPKIRVRIPSIPQMKFFIDRRSTGIDTYPVRYQKDHYTCGPASIVNALRCFGKKISEYKVRQFTSTTLEDGTSEDGICDALRSLGFKPTHFETQDKKLAWMWLSSSLDAREVQPVIIFVSNWNHVVTCIGILGKSKIVVFNSDYGPGNSRENGTHVFSKREIMKKWKHSKNGTFSGISILSSC